MSIHSRNGSFLVDRGSSADMAMTFFAVSTVIFVLTCVFIIVNPYFDWKYYKEPSIDESGVSQKGSSKEQAEEKKVTYS